MTERITTKEVERRFEYLAALVGKSTKVIVKGKWNIGAWRLDKNFAYGGYEIQEITSDHGGIHMPFGHGRLNSREFLSFLNGAIQGIEMGTAITPEELKGRRLRHFEGRGL